MFTPKVPKAVLLKAIVEPLKFCKLLSVLLYVDSISMFLA